MPTKTTAITQFRCEKCNAPYPLGADDVIATCPYCGYTFTVGSSEIKHLIIPNKLKSKSVKTAVTKWLRFAASKSIGSDFVDDIKLEEPMLQWIPFFRVSGTFESYYFGVETGKIHNIAVLCRSEAHDSGTMTEWVIARRHATTFGIDEFTATLDELDDSGIQDFDIDLMNGAPVLNSEIDDSDASIRAHSLKMERDHAKLLEKVEKIYDYRLKLTDETSTYTHAPYWLVRYTYQKGTFRVVVSGATGDILLGELPVIKQYRAKKWATSISLLIGSGLLLQVAPYLSTYFWQFHPSSRIILIIPAIMVVIAVILWVASITTLGGVLKYEVQVNTEGEELSKDFNIFTAIKNFDGGVKRCK